MGREGILPRIFGRTHSTHKSPFVATIVTVAVFCVVLTLLFATGLAGGAQRAALGIGVSSPLVALSQIGTWLPFQGNLLLFPIMALCSIAIIVLLRTRRPRRLSLVQDARSARSWRRRRSRSPST